MMKLFAFRSPFFLAGLWLVPAGLWAAEPVDAWNDGEPGLEQQQTANLDAIRASETYQQCLLEQLELVNEDATVAEVKQACDIQVAHSHATHLEQREDKEESLIKRRIARERSASIYPNTITPHQRNYFMPLTYVKSPNQEPYRNAAGLIGPEESLQHEEAKFQLSLKAPITTGLLNEYDTLFFGFTARSFWQVYNDDISAAFRETNYEPEFFWITPVDFSFLNTDINLFGIGISHQSNGNDLPLSRSWNRVYLNFIWEDGDWVFNFKPWWRIPEEKKTSVDDTSGDDNPDIDDYMGHFEFQSIYFWEDQQFGVLLRNNLRKDNKGAIQLDWTFPLWGNLRGYAQYFNGYGESLIDYDAHIERFGIGILLTDLL